MKFNYEIEILKRVTKLNHPHINKLIYSANLNNNNMAIVYRSFYRFFNKYFLLFNFLYSLEWG